MWLAYCSDRHIDPVDPETYLFNDDKILFYRIIEHEDYNDVEGMGIKCLECKEDAIGILYYWYSEDDAPPMYYLCRKHLLEYARNVKGIK